MAPALLDRLAELSDPRDRRGPPSAPGKPLRDRDAEHLDRLIGAWLADRHAAGWGHVALAGNAHRTSFNL